MSHNDVIEYELWVQKNLGSNLYAATLATVSMERFPGFCVLLL